MRASHYLLMTSLMLSSHAALALSSTALTDMILGGMTNTVDATSDLTSDDDDKRIEAAQEDAAYYIATQGQQRGAYLESALQYIRARHPELQATDEQLAQAILNQSQHP